MNGPTAGQRFWGGLIVQAARRHGIDPALALATWGKESGYSTDLSLKGEALSRGRGHALGPLQGVPYYHPQANFSDPQKYVDYFVQYMKKVGPAGYYGQGPAPAGHPTTGGYVSDIERRRRAIEAGTDPVIAGIYRPGTPPAASITIDVTQPAGYIDAQGHVTRTPPPRRGRRPSALNTMFSTPMIEPNDEMSQTLGMPLKDEQPMDPMSRLMLNPLTHIGLGILGADRGEGGWAQGVARGTMAGLMSFQAQQRLEEAMEETRQRQAEQRAERQRKMEYRDQMLRMAEQYAEKGMLSPEMMQAAITGNLPAWISALGIRNQMAQDQALANAAGGAGAEYPTVPAGTPGETATINLPSPTVAEPNRPTAPTPLPSAPTAAPTPPTAIPAAAEPNLPPPAAAPAPPTAPSPDVPPAPAPAAASPGGPPTASIPLVTRNPEIERGFREQEARIARLPPVQAWEARKALEEQKFNYQKEQANKLFQATQTAQAQGIAREKDIRAGEDSLRDEIHRHPTWKANEDIKLIANALPDLMKKALEKGDAAAFEVMMTDLSKVIDPGAASMLEEKKALQTGTILDDLWRWKHYFAVPGTVVTPEKIQEIYDVIETKRIAGAQAAMNVEKDYLSIAGQRGYNPSIIIPSPIGEEDLKPRPWRPATKPGRRQVSRTDEGFIVEEED